VVARPRSIRLGLGDATRMASRLFHALHSRATPLFGRGLPPSPTTPFPQRRRAGQALQREGSHSTVESVFRPSSEGPRGSAGPGPYHHAPSRLPRRGGMVEPPYRCASPLHFLVGNRTRVHAMMELLRGGACQADAGPMSARCRAMVLPCDGPAPALARGASTRDDLKITSTHGGGTHGGGNCAV